MAEQRKELWHRQRGPISFIAYEEPERKSIAIEGSVQFLLRKYISLLELQHSRLSQAELEEMVQQQIMEVIAVHIEAMLPDLKVAIIQARSGI